MPGHPSYHPVWSVLQSPVKRWLSVLIALYGLVGTRRHGDLFPLNKVMVCGCGLKYEHSGQCDQVMVCGVGVQYALAWYRIRQLKEADAKVQGEIVASNRGGLIVAVQHIRGFLPASHLAQVRPAVTLLHTTSDSRHPAKIQAGSVLRSYKDAREQGTYVFVHSSFTFCYWTAFLFASFCYPQPAA